MELLTGTAAEQARQERGLNIAKVVRIDRNAEGKWLVPSMSGNGKYTVDLNSGLFPTCTCPDHEQRQCKCKHIFAVEFASKRETVVNPDGSTTVTRRSEQPTRRTGPRTTRHRQMNRTIFCAC